MRKIQYLIMLVAVAMCCTGCLTRIITVADSTAPVRYTSPSYTQTYTTNPYYTTTTVRVPAQKVTTTTTVQVSPVTSDISLYLDLQAVAAAFAQSNTVEEFEEILNSYEYMISNLDLNGDGYVDYLRVMETMNGYNHLYVIQAVLAMNIYQDVATIVVEAYGASPYVQVIGHSYIYGAKYIIEPVFVRRPPMFDRYSRYGYSCWSSPYYYGHFPPHYHHCAPRHYSHYHSYVNTYMSNHKYCHEVHYGDNYHYSNYSKDTQTVSKNDYATAHPEGSFNSRNSAVTYTPSGTTTAQAVTNTRQLQQSISASGASRTTTTATGSRGTTTTSGTTNSRGTATATTTSGSTGSRTQTTGTTSTAGSRGTTTSATTSGSTSSRGTTTSTTTTTSAATSGSTGSRNTSSATTASGSTSVNRTSGSTSTSSTSRATGSSTGSTSSRSAATTTTTSRVSSRGTATTTSSTSSASRTSSSSSSTSRSTSSSTSGSTSSRTVSSSTSTTSRGSR